MSYRVWAPSSTLCSVSLPTFFQLMTMRALKFLMGAALLTSLAACGGKTSESASASSESHGDMMSESHDQMMADGEKGHDHMHDHDHMDDMSMMHDTIFTGAFQKAEHETKGAFEIHKHGDKTMLHLSEDFATNPGAPDLYVAIGAAANPIADKELPYPLAEGEYVTVAELTSATGAQAYDLPADIDLSEDNSVIIWCKQFNATMSYAPLEAAQ